MRSYSHKIYSVTSNKISMCNPNENDLEIQDDDDKITTYPRIENIPFIKYFHDTNIPNSIKYSKKPYKYFI